jgi:hypothetical protein
MGGRWRPLVAAESMSHGHPERPHGMATLFYGSLSATSEPD